MLLNKKHIKQFVIFYLLCFLLNYGWLFYNGLLFSSFKPVFFLNRLDFTFNIEMLTNLQHALINSKSLCICFDSIFLLLPFLLAYCSIKEKKWLPLIACSTGVFNIFYTLFLSSMTFITPANFIAWILVPLVFCVTGIKSFYYNLHTIRILFILMFFSAALWKIWGGGVYNSEEMAGILLRQHANLLVSNPASAYAQFIYCLVRHKAFLNCCYLLGFLAEFSFVIGLFTNKYDRFLILLFTSFVLFDYVLMQINLFEWMPFMGCFYFSRFLIAEKE